MAKPNRWLVLSALLLIYLIWGSTYLAVKYVIGSVPAFFLIAARNLLSGGILLGVAWSRRSAPLQWSHLKPAFLTGILLIAFGNGSVAFAQEHHVPSGTAALIVGAIPLWIGLLSMLRDRKSRSADPKAVLLKSVGLALGFTGLIVLLSATGSHVSADQSSAVVLAFLVIGTLTWAYGSVNGNRWRAHPDGLLATGLAMLAGSVVCFATSAGIGELGQVPEIRLGPPAIAAFLYLVIFGSVIAFSCYAWLLKHCDHTLVGTYAYANPIIALALGHTLAGEALTPATLVAGALVLGSVALITSTPWIVRSKLKPRTSDTASTALPRRLGA